MTLDNLYHWSPSANRDAIAKHGLRIMQPVSDDLVNPDGSVVRFPWVCLATSALRAWCLLPECVRLAEEAMDLWEVRLRDDDQWEARGDLGRRIEEVRLWHGLPPDRVRFVGTRGYGLHDTETPEASGDA